MQSTIQQRTTSSIIAAIISIFEQYRTQNTLPNDQYESSGKSILADKLNKFVANNQTIQFMMLGYPFKSINIRDKVIGDKPDLGERVSFYNFAKFTKAIQEVYSQGININMGSDGYVFNDVMGISDYTVQQYQDINEDMSKNAGASITFYNIKDFYSTPSPLSSIRDKATEQFGITEEELQRRILFDPNTNELYRGIMKFMNLDLAINNYPSNNQLKIAAKKMARVLMFRNEAYSHLMAHNFPDAIRLSMHNTLNDGRKYSFKLINSDKAWTSPWHCAILANSDGTLETIHRKDAEAMGCELIYENGQPFYYVRPKFSKN